jgi:peptide chain release factor 1
MVRVKDSIRLRLEKMVDRYEEIGRSLADPAVIGRQRDFRDLSVEYARLTPIAEKFAAFRDLEREQASAREMQNDNDPAMREMGSEEIARLTPVIEQAEDALKMLLIPRDPRDDKNIYLEVRAGTGGDEAAIFAGDLFRMYARFAETHGFHRGGALGKSRRTRRVP